jgi:hypothetical protein
MAGTENGGSAGSDTRALWVAIAVLAVAVVIVAFLALGDDDEDDDAVPVASTTTTQPSTSTTEAPASTTTTATTMVVDVDRSTAVWPWEDESSYDDPVDAAEVFAVDYLGFTDPIVGEFQQGDTRSGEVGIKPTEDGPATTILVRQLSGEDTWSVLGAVTENLEVSAPEAGDAISSPVDLEGEALAYEGNVEVEIRQDGSAEPIGEGFVTGGGDEMRPFSGSIEFDDPTSEYGAIVFIVRSAEDGSVWQAAAMRVQFDS